MVRILIVDKLFDNIIALESMLSEHFKDVQMLKASNSDDALSLAIDKQPDLVLLDPTLDGKDGYEVTRYLKNNENTHDIPVVLVTTLKETRQNRIKALEAGVDGFLSKPLDEVELKMQVSAMLRLKQGNDKKKAQKAELEALVKERTKVLEQELEIRRKTEQELLRAEKSWTVTFNAMNEGVLLVDVHQNVIKCNAAFERIVGKDQAQIIGHNSHSLIHNDNETYDQLCPFDRMLKTKQREVIEIVVNNKNYELVVDPVFSKKKLDGAVLIIKDISDHIRAQEEIQKERQQLRTLIDNLPSLIYFKDKEGRKIIANKADIENIKQLTDHDVIGYTDREIFDGAIGERGYDDDMQVIHSATPIIDREEQFGYVDDNPRWILTSKFPLFDKQGNVTGLVGVGNDITQQKELIEELRIAKDKAEESDRLKSAFLANMSHEIRTPMNGIMGFTDLLKADDIEPAKRKMYISNIQKSGYRMLNTVNDLIEISKIEVGQMSMHLRSFDLHKTIVDICEFFRSEAEKKGLRLQCTIPNKEDAFMVNTDVSKLESILTNLIKNAIKYTDKGHIEFSYEIKGDYFEFYCKDTGIGIPQNRLNAVFNRFEQADIEDRLALQGSGLGLAITKAYVEMMEGEIWVESELNQGSCFYFTLPISIMKKDRIDNDNANDITKTVMDNKKKILIVDDDQTSLTFLKIILEPYATELYIAVTGLEAVEICKEKEPDIIFMDMKMPVMTGYDATRKIREFNPDVPIIAQSAYALGGDREKAIEAGCTDYITKPIIESKLKEFLK